MNMGTRAIRIEKNNGQDTAEALWTSHQLKPDFVDLVSYHHHGFRFRLILVACYGGSMPDSMKRPLRWILALAILEVVLGAILYLMGDATTGPKFTFFLLVLVVNFPGVIVAARLSPSGQDTWMSSADPVLGWTVIVGVSLLFYGGCILGIHRALTPKAKQPDPWKIPRGRSGGTKGGEAS